MANKHHNERDGRFLSREQVNGYRVQGHPPAPVAPPPMPAVPRVPAVARPAPKVKP